MAWQCRYLEYGGVVRSFPDLTPFTTSLLHAIPSFIQSQAIYLVQYFFQERGDLVENRSISARVP